MSLFYISSWLTLKKIKLKNYKNYTASQKTLGRPINTRFLNKGLCKGNLSPTHEIFVEKSAITFGKSVRPAKKLWSM